ncbi:hypothetical protein [Micromonospora sp. NBC_00617]|uniref:hypothetical protein n=2 Tax=Micromonospora sp. NBC_00617 TaxID=2903587 RepID=UPI0030E23AD7
MDQGVSLGRKGREPRERGQVGIDLRRLWGERRVQIVEMKLANLTPVQSIAEEIMELFVAFWAHWLALGSSFAPATCSHEAVPASRTLFGRRPELTALDLSLIQLIYEVVAADSKCIRCGAPLSRQLHVAKSAADYCQSWTVSVLARCSGWRRHQYVATVDDGSNGFVLGPFHSPGRHAFRRRR